MTGPFARAAVRLTTHQMTQANAAVFQTMQRHQPRLYSTVRPQQRPDLRDAMCPLIERFKQTNATAAYEVLQGLAAMVGPPPVDGEGQRALAVAVLRDIAGKEDFTVAAVARLAVEPFYTTAGEVGAGNIGTHYKDEVPDKLAALPTDANLWALARHETEFWNSDRGSLAGSMMSADTRYYVLLAARKDWEATLAPEARQRWEQTKQAAANGVG